MIKLDPDREEFKKAVRDHIAGILNTGVTRREMGDILGVTRAGISSYVIGRTVPKPHIIQKLLTKWPTKLSFKNATFEAGAFDTNTQKLQPVYVQKNFIEALNSVQSENLKITVKESGATDLVLTVSIKIAG